MFAGRREPGGPVEPRLGVQPDHPVQAAGARLPHGGAALDQERLGGRAAARRRPVRVHAHGGVVR